METQTQNGPDWFSKIFRLAMGWKIIYGIGKIILGLAILKWATIDPSSLFYKLMGHEIIEDPDDILIRLVEPLLTHLSVGTTTFAASYLIFWGLVDDIFLSINILRDRLWAFSAALALFGLFISYEIYRFFHTHSFFLLFIVAIDIGIVWLIAVEYRKAKNRIHETK
ncbi:hypothetical protein CL652_00010 [bacterium]|nr:hypothetical protein [bacterium]|tara:strand:- start:6131 stop:6631 length:501 start_codon:yes stop_codon:yes gene_type:complete